MYWGIFPGGKRAEFPGQGQVKSSDKNQGGFYKVSLSGPGTFALMAVTVAPSGGTPVGGAIPSPHPLCRLASPQTLVI